MNEQNQLVLYTDARTKDIAGVLMQIQAGIKKPCIFVSHALSKQALRNGVLWSWNCMPSSTASSIHLSTCCESNL